MPKRRSAKLTATKKSATPIGRQTRPAPTFVRFEETRAPAKLSANQRKFNLRQGARLLGKFAE
jgi:hypothetical protein